MGNLFRAVGQAAPALISEYGALQQIEGQEEARKQKAIQFGYAQRQMKDEEEWQNRPIPVDIISRQFQNMPGAGEHFMQYLQGAGLVKDLNGIPSVLNKDLQRAKKAASGDVEFQKVFMNKISQDSLAAFQIASQALVDAQGSGNEKKIGQAQQAYDAARKNLMAAAEAQNAWASQLNERKAKQQQQQQYRQILGGMLRDNAKKGAGGMGGKPPTQANLMSQVRLYYSRQAQDYKGLNYNPMTGKYRDDAAAQKYFGDLNKNYRKDMADVVAGRYPAWMQEQVGGGGSEEANEDLDSYAEDFINQTIGP